MLLWNHMRMRGKASSVYQALRSLRFRASNSAYLSRAFVTGNQQIWTYSKWFKLGSLGVQQNLLQSGAVGGSVLYLDASGALHLSLTISAGETRVTTRLLRDPAAHYHLMVVLDTTQVTSANRVKLFINGVQETAFTTSGDPTINSTFAMNAANTHAIGQSTAQVSGYFDGYISEVNFVGGQALAPTAFGKYDKYGNWQAIKYTGTYGTNGFYLDFSDPSSTTNICLDRSGNGNHWTPNGISVTAGATYDSMLDVPLGGGGSERGNYATWNPLGQFTSGYVTCSDGNLKMTRSSNAGDGSVASTIAVASGKWYFEFTCGGSGSSVGVSPESDLYAIQNTSYWVGSTAKSYGYHTSGQKGNSTALTAYGAAYTTADVVGVKLDLDAGNLEFLKNGVSQGVAFTGLVGTFLFAISAQPSTSHNANFGQRPFTYTPPVGCKALHTGNLPDPVVPNPKTGFSIAGWIGNASTKVINGVLFQADILWGKCRSAVTNWSQHDSARGAVNRLNSNTTAVEVNDSSVLASFNSDGFTLGGSAALNANASTNAGWLWKKGAVFGVDVVQATLTSGNQTVAHALGVVPELIIAKSRNTVSNWSVWVSGFTKDEYVLLNTTDSKLTTTNAWGAATPTVSNFGLNGGTLFAVSDQVVAYLFSSVRGYSKVGVFLGNGSIDGPFVDCGFKPAFILTKRVLPTGAADWFITDTTSNPYNVAQTYLAPNVNVAEEVNSAHNMDILSNGFKLRTAQPDRNTSGGTFIYLAFAETPFKYTLAR